MRDEIKAYLAADSTLSAIVTGGLFVGLEITRQLTPGAFNSNGDVLPCILVRDGSQAPDGPHPDGARAYISIFFYQQTGYEEIDAARKRVYELLHRQTAAIAGVWDIRHVNDTPVLDDPALRCSMALSEFVMAVNRSRL